LLKYHLVVHVSKNYDINAYNNIGKGDFDLEVLRDRLGKRLPSQLKIISIKDISGPSINKGEIFDIKFEVDSDKITCKRRDDNLVVVEVENIFNSDRFNVKPRVNFIPSSNISFASNTEFFSTQYFQSLAIPPTESPRLSPRKFNEESDKIPTSFPWERDPNWKKPF
jgi:hypothetical protein